ncbi:anti-sigma factor [Bacillus andreraoultii]|uniref:anti-sigma factor n=1 Tax=Bacillus andreraoultii TaxID=1499685 RepID=UPI00053BA79C|nr:anti-sigma factor [Bacillus andreraoultii]
MNCKEVQKLMDNYLEGKCSGEESREVDNHLETCGECREWLDGKLKEQENVLKPLNSSPETLNMSSVKKQNKILRRAKWKNRMNNVFTVIVSLIILMVVLSLLTGLYYGQFIDSDNSKLNRAKQAMLTTTEVTMPNVIARGGGSATSAFFTASMDYELSRQIGRDTETIGEIHGKMFFNQLNITRSWVDGSYDVKLEFFYPAIKEELYKENKESLANGLRETWGALDKLPEGTVSELAISFDNLYDIDQINKMMSDYDIDVTWFAVDTGGSNMPTLDNFPFTSAVTGIWGFSQYTLLEFSGETGSDRTLENRQEDYEKAFKNMLTFLNDNEKYVQNYLWDLNRGDFQKMRHYVDKNGLKCYGVVVTGPTKELLKFRDNKQITYASLGEVDFWNWFDRNFGGEMN